MQEESGLESSKSGAEESVVGHCSGRACRLGRRTLTKLGTPGNAAQPWMETSPEEVTHPSRKLKAAGFTQGFQVRRCKVKWFTITETSFPGVLVFFPLVAICVAHLAACPKEFLFLTRLSARAPPQPRQIPSSSWITPLTSKSSHGFVLHWIKAKAATVRTLLISCEYYYQLREWNFVVLL